MAWNYLIKIKPYWDNLNGNSYHAGRIYDTRTEELIAVLPFAYGDEYIGLNHAYNVVSGFQSEKMHMHDVKRLCTSVCLTDTGEQDCRDYGVE